MIKQLSTVILVVVIQHGLSVNTLDETSSKGDQEYFLRKNRTIYIGAMGPIAESRHITWGAGIIESMKLAIDIINRRSDILPEYKLQLVPRNTKVNVLANFSFVKMSNFQHERTKFFVLVSVLGMILAWQSGAYGKATGFHEGILISIENS